MAAATTTTTPSPTATATATAYPCLSRTASTVLSDPTATDTSAHTTTAYATSIYFADKILITICHEGRGLSQWYHIPLDAVAPSPSNGMMPPQRYNHSAGTGTGTGTDTGADADTEPLDLLPLPHLTPVALLGAGGGGQRESLGQLYAVQIATAISMRDPSEARTVLVGLGLRKGANKGGGAKDVEAEAEVGRDEFFEILELVGKVLV